MVAPLPSSTRCPSARIEGNVIDNVHGACTPADGVGVLLSESRDVVVTNNTITNAESSVLVQQIDRNRFSGDISHWAVTVTPDTDRLWVTRNLTITDNVLGPTTDGCEDAPGGRVGLLVEDVGNHPNTENVAPEVTFSNNDFAGTEESVAFLWPTSPTPLTFAEWTAPVTADRLRSAQQPQLIACDQPTHTADRLRSAQRHS
ncbi:MAG: hypothetical protein R2710_19265 [Acidimicrobiales bacterium]